MLNLFSKTTPWMVASLLAATVAIAAQDNNTKGQNRPQKSYEQGHEVTKNQLMAGYNAPAGYDVRGSWDVYATATFLYWQGREDNLELGIVSNGTPITFPSLGSQSPFVPLNPLPTATLTADSVKATTINPDFSYGPGFQLGLGLNLDYDGWDAYAEYTWFHKKSSNSFCVKSKCSQVPIDGVCTQAPTQWVWPTRIMPVGLTFGDDSEKTYRCVGQTWNLKTDFVDLSLARSYYSGTRLTVRPFFGARGAWIRQTLKTTFTEETIPVATLGGVLVSSDPDLSQTQGGTIRSWGVGPRAGFESNWLVGCGFRLIGDASADVLYTRYDVKTTSSITSLFYPNLVPGTPIDDTSTDSTGVESASASLTQRHLDVLRPHVDLEMGFGWGAYFDNSNWHVDLLATYGYQVFWDQNMFRDFTDDFSRTVNPNGNLYIHGLTLTARVDF